MATIRIHQEDQENRITGDLRGRGKENLAATTTAAATVNTQTQVLHQTKRAVLGVLHNNCPRNGTKPVRKAISRLSRFALLETAIDITSHVSDMYRSRLHWILERIHLNAVIN